jgi:hypothetical protein
MTPELMAGSSPNFYHRYLIKIHGIIPGFWFDLLLTYFQNGIIVGTFHYYLTLNILTLCEHVSRQHLHFYQDSARSAFKYGQKVAILEN